MVYESDFYTYRRPYSTRITPTISSYSVSTIPTQITKYLPGYGKVYVVNSYPSYVIPYVGHKRITYYTPSPMVHIRPSIYLKELDRIEHKYRPSFTYSYLNDYLNSPSATIWRVYSYVPSVFNDYLDFEKTFDDEKRAIRAQSNAILQRIHSPVPRVRVRVVPLSTVSYHDSLYPIRISSDAYVNRIVSPVRRVADNILNISYYTEPAKRFIGPGHLACIRYAGDKAYSKRKHFSDLTDHVIRNDINLLSYYLKNRQAASTGGIEKPISVVGLSSVRPSRHFSTIKPLPDPADEKREIEALKAAQRAQKQDDGIEDAAKLREKRRAEKAAEEQALAEEIARQKEKAKKEEAERQKQAELEKQRLLEEEAEREAQRIEKARKEAEQRQKEAEEERLAAEQKAEEERLAAEQKAEEARLEAERKAEEARLEAERKAEEERLEAERKAEEARAEEERRQAELNRLEEIAKQAEEASLQRQAEELAEIARQESELAKQQETVELDAAAEPTSPPAEAEDNMGGAESADEQADIPTEEASAEPIIDEPQTPEQINVNEQQVEEVESVEVEEKEDEEEEEEEEE